MLEATTTPNANAGFAGRAAGWLPQSQSQSNSRSPRKNRRRRESKGVYHSSSTIARCAPSSPPRNAPNSSHGKLPAAYSYSHMPSRPIEQMRPRSEAEQPFKVESVDYFKSQYNDYDGGPAIHPQNRAASSWQSDMISYTLAPQPAGSNQFVSDNIPSQNGFSFDVSNDLASSWNEIIPNRGNIGIGMNNPPALDIPLAREARYGSLDSVPGCSPKSSGTSNSDGYVFPLMPPGVDQNQNSGTDQLCDFELSDEYFYIGQPADPSSAFPACTSSMYQDPFFSNHGLPMTGQLDFASTFTTVETQWPGSAMNMPPQRYDAQGPSNTEPDPPWSLDEMTIPKSRTEKTVDNRALEPSSAPRFEINAPPEEIHKAPSTDGQISQGTHTPVGDSESEGWIISFDPNTYTPSHSSPRSQKSSPSHVSSPGHNESAPSCHPHVFSSFAGITKPSISRGRQRNLTALEKRQAREVREAKACWACHISKTKCSPCSPGSPCTQCARLVGKRRFCKFTCFNDPLESLYRFLVPDYLMAHFTKQDVEAFVGRNTKSWGTQSLLVRMAWGYRRPLEAEVVALELHSDHSEAGFQTTTISDGSTKPLLVRKRSPPLGIPLAAMDDLQITYSHYVQDIVQTDLTQYVPVAHFKGDSGLLTRLLGIVCSFYYSGRLESDVEADLLRQALEIHVTCVILEKSLILDRESTRLVQDHLQQEYPEKPVPRCVQRQIKLALFLEQQNRIHKVLKEWGNMMWTIGKTNNNDKKWAVSFCVLMIIVLVIDKISVSAFYFCEAEIQHHGADPKSERAKFMQLISLTENELFERCKEIFHWKFKTRKGGKEACNPIRDGMEAFRGRAVGGGVASLTSGLQALVRDFGIELKSHSSLDKSRTSQASVSPYTDSGRLACIFLADFLDN